MPSRAPSPALLSRRLPALAALALAGCASMAPLHTTPALPVPESYAAPEIDTAAQAAGTASAGWRDYFIDPALQALIEQSLAHNRDLRAAVLRVDEARFAYGIQRADLLPSVGMQVGVERSRMPGAQNPSGRPVVGSQYQMGLALASWELDFWGRLRSLSDAALQNYLATSAARHAMTVSLVAQVANGYLALRELDERLSLAKQSSASREESLRISKRRVEVGSSSRLTLTQTQTLLTQAQALVAQLELERARQSHTLELLVGAPVALPLAAAHLDAQHLPPLAAGLPSALLTQRPDIVAAEHQLRSANAQIGAARAAFFPRISLTGSLGSASTELDGLFGSGSTAWTFSPSISVPIFNAGRLKNNLVLAEVRRDLAVAHYEKTVQQAFRDVSDALAGRQWLTLQRDIAQDALAAQTERARLSQLRYEHGAAPFLDVLDAQRDLLMAQQQAVQAQRALLSNQVGLYAALGGGALTSTTLPTESPKPKTP